MTRKSQQAPSTTTEATEAPSTTETIAQVTTEETPKAKAEPKPLPTLDEALDTARKDNPERYARVVRVVAQTKDGRPARVVITCADPQTKQGPDGNRVSVCEGEREIATQDLFQVVCCAACADRKVKMARRQRTKNRIRTLRAQLAEAKGQTA